MSGTLLYVTYIKVYKILVSLDGNFIKDLIKKIRWKPAGVF